MEKIQKPKNVYLLVYLCGRVFNDIYYTEKAAIRMAEMLNKFYDSHIRVIKYKPEI